MRTRDQSGTVTAETAVVLPLIAVLTLGMAWLVSLGVTHVRAVDAARETARAVARGDAAGAAVALGKEVAPGGSRFAVSTHGRRVVVTVSAPVRAPGGLFAFLPDFDVHAQSVAAREPTG